MKSPWQRALKKIMSKLISSLSQRRHPSKASPLSARFACNFKQQRSEGTESVLFFARSRSESRDRAKGAALRARPVELLNLSWYFHDHNWGDRIYPSSYSAAQAYIPVPHSGTEDFDLSPKLSGQIKKFSLFSVPSVSLAKRVVRYEILSENN